MYMQPRASHLPRDNEILECPLSRGTLASTDNVLVKNDHSHIWPQEIEMKVLPMDIHNYA